MEMGILSLAEFPWESWTEGSFGK